MLGKALTTAAAGSAAGAAGALGVEDVFSTWLYDGTGASQTITNGIDLSGEGGLVWIKNRDNANDHLLFDSERTLGYKLSSNTTDSEANFSINFTSFNSDGFTIAGNGTSINSSSYDYASWTFRKAEKFFDVVTWTGDGNSPRSISHSLGSTPGFIIVKKYSESFSWYCYHTSLGATKAIKLESTALPITSANWWDNTAPTSTEFTVQFNFNETGKDYVAYVFAHDAGGFGDDGTESVIKCGSHTVSSGTGGEATVNLGWEPQWVLIKRTNSAQRWWLVDNMRLWGVDYTSKFAYLAPNESTVENSANDGIRLTSTGFKQNDGIGTGDFIYIAIRRGPMKTPTDATKVFSVQEPTGNGSATTITTGFPVDLTFAKAVSDSSASWWWVDRLRGETKYLSSNSTDAEATYSSNPTELDNNTGVVDKNYGSTTSVFADYLFRRAPGFFDVVAYQGTGVAHTENHNLGVVPEMMIIRHRNRAGQNWCVYHKALGNFYRDRLNLDIAAGAGNNFFNSTDPTSSVFTVGTDSEVNNSASGYIAYLFATVSNVSKVGSYTGTGTTIDVNCGFTAGARFVLIKRTDDSGYSWYVWDTARGIVSGNDPYLLINSIAAEVTSTDYIDPLSSGFQITSSAPAAINALGGSYIFLAIA